MLTLTLSQKQNTKQTIEKPNRQQNKKDTKFKNGPMFGQATVHGIYFLPKWRGGDVFVNGFLHKELKASREWLDWGKQPLYREDHTNWQLSTKWSALKIYYKLTCSLNMLYFEYICICMQVWM